MEAATTQQSPTTVRLGLRMPRLEGRHLATMVAWARRVGEGTVTIEGVDVTPPRVELGGSSEAIGRLRSAVEHGAPELSEELRPTLLPEALPVDGRRVTRVLVVDGRLERAREHAAILARADIEAFVVAEAREALALLRGSALVVDALVVRHELGDGTGLQLLESIPAAQRRYSVLVIDANPDRGRAHEYRMLGAHRYVEEPHGALEVIGCVHSTVCDTLAWRGAGRRRRDRFGEEPPRVYLDPDHAADRLAHVYQLAPVERQVAHMVLMGLRDVDIAQRLGRSERTAKRHVGKILEKAEIQNRSSLWAVLYQEVGGDAPERSREIAAHGAASSSCAPHSPAAGPAESRPGYRSL